MWQTQTCYNADLHMANQSTQTWVLGHHRKVQQIYVNNFYEKPLASTENFWAGGHNPFGIEQGIASCRVRPRKTVRPGSRCRQPGASCSLKVGQSIVTAHENKYCL